MVDESVRRALPDDHFSTDPYATDYFSTDEEVVDQEKATGTLSFVRGRQRIIREVVLDDDGYDEEEEDDFISTETSERAKKRRLETHEEVSDGYDVVMTEDDSKTASDQCENQTDEEEDDSVYGCNSLSASPSSFLEDATSDYRDQGENGHEVPEEGSLAEQLVKVQIGEEFFNGLVIGSAIVPVLDKYGYLLGEFRVIDDDMRICKNEDHRICCLA